MDWFNNLFSDDSSGYDDYSYDSGGYDSSGWDSWFGSDDSGSDNSWFSSDTSYEDPNSFGGWDSWFGDDTSASSSDSSSGWFDPTEYGDYSDYTGDQNGYTFGGDAYSEMGPTNSELGYFGSEAMGPTYEEMGYGGANPATPGQPNARFGSPTSRQQQMDQNGWYGPSPNGSNLDQMTGSDQFGNPVDAQGQLLNGGGSSVMGRLAQQVMGGGGQQQGGGGGMFGGGGSSGGGMTDLLLALGLGGAAAAFLPKLLNSADGGSSGQPSITAPNYYAQFQSAGGIGDLPNFNPGAPQGVAPGTQMSSDPLAGGRMMGAQPAAASFAPQAQGPVDPAMFRTPRTLFPGSV